MNSFNWCSPKSTLSKILNDEILIQHSPPALLKRYQDALEGNEYTINITDLLAIIEDNHILLLKNQELIYTLEKALLVSRVLLVNNEDNSCFFFSSCEEAKEIELSIRPESLTAYTLMPKFPNKPLSKWQFAWIQCFPLWRKYALTLVLLAIAAIISILPLIAIGPIFNSIVPRGEIPQLLIIGLALVLAQVIGSFLRLIASVFSSIYENDITYRSYIGIIDRYLSAQPLSLPKRDNGLWSQTFQTAMAFTSSIKTVFVHIPLSFFTIILNCIAFGVSLAKPFVVIFLLALSMVPAIINVLFGWRVGRISFALVSVNSQIDQQLYKTISSIGDIRSLGFEASFESRFRALRQRLNRVILRMNAWSQSGIFLNTTLAALLTAVILFLYSDSAGISQGSYLIIFVAFSSVSSAFTELAQSLSQLLASAPTYFSKNPLRDIDKYSIYQTASRLASSKGPETLTSIELINTTFSYDPTTPLIVRFSSLFSNNNSYAITGESGSGKSTILKVIAGAYKPTSGQVLVNRLSNSDMINNLVKFNVIYIPQRAKLLGDTIREFLDPFGKYEDNSLKTALQSAEILDLTMALPMGLSTVISEFCGDLSTSQLQHFHIARVILHQPDLVLADEPFSHIEDKQKASMLKQIRESANLFICTLDDKSLIADFTHVIQLQSLVKSTL
jgi:ATP-binding cassette subfamily C protein LapB